MAAHHYVVELYILVVISKLLESCFICLPNAGISGIFEAVPRSSQQIQRGTCVYIRHIYTQTHTLTSKFIFIYVEKHEFTPLPTMPVQHYRIHSSPVPFLLSLYITPSLTVRKLAFIILNTLVIVSTKNTSAGGDKHCQQPGRKCQSPSWVRREGVFVEVVRCQGPSDGSFPPHFTLALATCARLPSSLQRCSPYPSQALMPRPALLLPHLCADAYPVQPT